MSNCLHMDVLCGQKYWLWLVARCPAALETTCAAWSHDEHIGKSLALVKTNDLGGCTPTRVPTVRSKGLGGDV